jgi:flavorubredoxin
MFPLVSEPVSRIMPLGDLRWITFGHYEADECGAMNEWLAVAPNAQVAHGMTGCSVSLNDMADRPPRVLANGEVIDIGGKRIRYIDTPHVPHGWDAGVIYEENSRTLFCGDLFTHLQWSGGHGERHHGPSACGRGHLLRYEPRPEHCADGS